MHEYKLSLLCLIPIAFFAIMKSSCIIPTIKFLTRYAQEPNPIITIVINGNVMWYSKAPKYSGLDAGMSGVALAGKIWYVNANKNIINIPIHQTGKLELIIAKLDVILSIVEPILLADSAPTKIPIIEIKIVAVVNNKIVLGSFSKIISFNI